MPDLVWNDCREFRGWLMGVIHARLWSRKYWLVESRRGNTFAIRGFNVMMHAQETAVLTSMAVQKISCALVYVESHGFDSSTWTRVMRRRIETTQTL
jgi:hypothetical protein